jgi:hypothetical protein
MSIKKNHIKGTAMNRILSFLATILIFSSTSVATVQESQQHKLRVKVTFSADENIEGKVKSYINRELRDLGDVELVDYYPELELDIVAIEQTKKSDNKVGIVLSMVVISTFDNWYLLTVVPASKKENADKATNNLDHFFDHWVMTGSTEDLRKLCNGIIADLDTEYLENMRKLRRQYIEKLQESE